MYWEEKVPRSLIRLLLKIRKDFPTTASGGRIGRPVRGGPLPQGGALPRVQALEGGEA